MNVAAQELKNKSSVLFWKYFLLFSSLLLASIAIINIVSATEATKEWPYHVMATFLIWLMLYLVATYNYFGTLYNFISAYIFCLAVFHLGHLVVHVTGLYDVNYLVRSNMAFWHQQAAWVCMLAFASLGVGTAMSFTRKVISTVIQPDLEARIDHNLNYVFWIGLGLLIASLIALGMTIGSVGNILRFSRAEIFQGVGDTRGLGFFLMIIPSAVVLLVVGANTKPRKLFSYSLAIVVALLILFLGYRSSVLFPALCGAILWVKLGRKIPLTVSIVTVLAVLIAIPAVSYLRAQGAYQEISSSDIERSLEEAREAEKILVELGGVSSVVAYVLKSVPDEWPYRFGQSYAPVFATSATWPIRYINRPSSLMSMLLIC